MKDTVDHIVSKIQSRLLYQYSNNIVTKPYVKEYLKSLHDRGGRMFVLTASPHIVTDVFLKRNGIFDWFEKVWSVDDLGLSKSDTRRFFEVAKTIGGKPSEVHYFDDSLIALENAKKTGYFTYGGYAAQSDEELLKMKNEITNAFVMTFKNLL